MSEIEAGGATVSPEDAFGEVLRELRRERGWSQERLAEAAGCTRPYISYLETGKYGPTLSMLFQLAGALGVPAQDLVQRTGTKMSF